MGFLHRLASALGGRSPSRWAKSFQGLSLLAGSLDEKLPAWVETGTGGEILLALPKPDVWTLLGTVASVHQAYSSNKGWSEAGAEARKARWEAYANSTVADASQLVRLGKLFAAAVGTIKVVRSAGPDIPDWLHLLVQDMVCIQGFIAKCDLNTVCAEVREKLPYLTADLLHGICQTGDVQPRLMLRLVLERLEDDWGSSLDALGSAVGMTRWVESLGPVFAEECLKLSNAGRRNAASAIGLWGIELLHADLLTKLAVDANKTVRAEAQRQLSKVPAQSQESLFSQILSSGNPSQRELAASQLARVGTVRAGEILREAAAAGVPDRLRVAIEGAVGTLATVRSASQDVLSDLPPWNPYPIPVLGSDVRSILVEAHRQLLATTRESAAKEQANNLKHNTSGHGYKFQLERLQEFSVDRLIAVLSSPENLGKTRFHASVNSVLGHDKSLATRCDFGLHRVLACIGFQENPASGFWDNEMFQEWLKGQDRTTVDLRAVARALADVGLPVEWIESACLGTYWQQEDKPQESLPPRCVWPFFVEHPEYIDSRLGIGASRLGTWESVDEAKCSALDVLETFPAIPAHLIAPLLDLALGTAKTHRHHAQEVLSKLPDIVDRICQAVENPSQEIRIAAARWLTRVAPAKASEFLDRRLGKETRESARAALLSCLESLGADLSEALSPRTLQKEAAKGLKGGIPKALDWFPVSALPACRYQDGSVVERSVIEWWLVLAHKLKEPGANPLLVRYLSLLDTSSREDLGLFVLRSFIAQDARVATLEEANTKALQEAPTRLATYQQYTKTYGGHWASKTLESCVEEIRDEVLATYLGSRIADKGILALCALAPGAKAVEATRQYMKDHHTRRAQIEAVLEALSVGADPLVIQLILSVARRHRTASIQEKARTLVDAIALRRNWSTDDLADRTIPTAGLDDTGVLVLDYGPRQFLASLDPMFKSVLKNAEGKEIKALPDPNQSDDETMAKEAKSRFQAMKKGVKQVVELQTARLYEAMCSQRTWLVQEWREFLQAHPVVGPLVRNLVWADDSGRTFRPCEDLSLVGMDDDSVVVADGSRIRLAHGSLLSDSERLAWTAHLKDYKVKPVFGQMDRPSPGFDPGQTEIGTRLGWMSDTFTLRGLFNKRGYQRSQAEDGGWFFHYAKEFHQAGVRVTIEFTGNSLPETNVAAALKTLRFERIQKKRSTIMELSAVPPVLLAEAHGDYLQIAEGCRGFDPEWEKKQQW